MATITQYGSIKFLGSHPNKLPDGLGDIYMEQDRIRDFAWVWDRVGALAADIAGVTAFLASGGIVTAHAGNTTVDVTAGVGYAPFTIPLANTAANPPLTADEDLTSVRVAWGAQTGIGTLAGTTTYYVKVIYAEVDSLTRQRLRAVGTWAFTKTPSYTFVIDTSAPTAYQILLATLTVNAGSITAVNQAAWTTPGNLYDIVIDSNAKLDAWARATLGQFKRVLIKTGTWTASALGPTAGVLINLDNTGTTYVFSEKGSSINYSGSYGGTMYGLYHVTRSTDLSVERFDNVKVIITNTSNNNGWAIHNCTNLFNCTGSGTATSGCGRGFNNCDCLSHCTGISSGNVTAIGTGFYSCTNVVNCYGSGTGSGSFENSGFYSCNWLTDCTGTGTGSGTAEGFGGCKYLSNCTGTGTAPGTSTGAGFYQCQSIVNCVGTGSGGSSSGNGLGFASCVGVTLCAGQGLAAGSGNGYGFNGCTKMQQNKASAASKTATYTTSYADSGAGNACADTAAGGYNS